jgi:hypothetical protein
VSMLRRQQRVVMRSIVIYSFWALTAFYAMALGYEMVTRNWSYHATYHLDCASYATES